MLYRLLFHTALSFDRLAAKREASGKDASGLRSFFVSRAKLNPGENGAVFQVASDAEQTDAAIVARQRKLIADWKMQAHAAVAGGLRPQPPPLAEIEQLQGQRDALAMRERDQLHTLLGDDGFERLEVYVHRQFGGARHLKLPMTGTAGTAAGGGQ